MNIVNKGVMVESMLQKFNPFAFVSSNGDTMIYATTVDAYIAMMMHVYTAFPRGYIEMPLLIKSFYPHLAWKDCCKVTDDIKTFGLQAIEHVDFHTPNAKMFFCKLAGALCSLTGTKYSEYYVTEGYQIFKNRIIIDQNEKRIKPTENNE